MMGRSCCVLLVGLLGLNAALRSAPLPVGDGRLSSAEIEQANELLKQISKKAAQPEIRFEQVIPLWQQCVYASRAPGNGVRRHKC